MLFERGWKHALKRVFLLCLLVGWRVGVAAHLAHDEEQLNIGTVVLNEAERQWVRDNRR